jgi:hypothetical protein
MLTQKEYIEALDKIEKLSKSPYWEDGFEQNVLENATLEYEQAHYIKIEINTSSEYINAMDKYYDLIENYDPANEELFQRLIDAMNTYDLKYRDGNPPPEILANALQDRIHETSGKLLKCRAAKTVRNKK